MQQPQADITVSTGLSAIGRVWGPASRADAAEPPRTLAGSAFARMRADIIRGRLAPGAPLRLHALKAEYEAGFSPLREALCQLAADGLVVTVGQKGFRVAPVSLNELREVAALRSELDSMALRAAIARAGAAWKAGIALALTRLSAAEARLRHPRQKKRRRTESVLEDALREMHFALIGGCGSPWLAHFCERIYDQAERYRRCFPAEPPHAEFRLANYNALVDAALAEDSGRACRLLARLVARQSAHTAAAMRRRGHAAQPAEAIKAAN